MFSGIYKYPQVGTFAILCFPLWLDGAGIREDATTNANKDIKPNARIVPAFHVQHSAWIACPCMPHLDPFGVPAKFPFQKSP